MRLVRGDIIIKILKSFIQISKMKCKQKEKHQSLLQGTEPSARMQLTKLYRNWNYQERIKPEVDLDNLQNSLKHKYNLARARD